MHVMKFLDFIRDHLQNKLGIGDIHVSYVVHGGFSPDSFGGIILTLPYSKYIGGFREDLISRALRTRPVYSEDNYMVLKVLLHCFQGINHMISVKPYVGKCNGRGSLLDLEQHNMGISKWDTIVKKVGPVLCNQVCNGSNPHYPLTKHIYSNCNAHGDIT